MFMIFIVRGERERGGRGDGEDGGGRETVERWKERGGRVYTLLYTDRWSK